MDNYSQGQEQLMKCLYGSLDEASKRRYAGVEAEKLGLGGKKYITGLFQCSVNTLSRGQKEISSGLQGVERGRIRKSGGGRKLSKKDPLKEKGVSVSRTVVKQLLKEHGYVKRKSQKNKAIGKSKNRNEQFENIQHLKEFHQQQGDPVISMDTKKKSR